VLSSWGEGLFRMPHMVTVDRWGAVWVTDVGLHQALKFDAHGRLLMTLGKRLESGTGDSFCKPTQVPPPPPPPPIHLDDREWRG